ncbi:MAG: hypothetical protein GX432_00080 [Candidatus Atribacteria bacterium]|nr:hypothetical protein [Candidatus Atribacteria bacterium]
MAISSTTLRHCEERPMRRGNLIHHTPSLRGASYATWQSHSFKVFIKKRIEKDEILTASEYEASG